MEKFSATTIQECNLIELPKIHNRAGNLTSLNNIDDLPFNTKRVYYLYDVPSGGERGGHAHKNLHQLIVSGSGSFDIVLNDGKNSKVLNLNRPNFGLLIVPGIWRELKNFSSGAICLVLASELYEKEDYIRDFEEFRQLKK